MTLFQPELTPKRNSQIISLVTGSWYEAQFYDPTVMVDPSNSANLIMFASGMAAPVQSGIQTIGKFTSTVASPYSWSNQGQVLLPGASGAWDDYCIRCGSVLYISGTYYMFYNGWRSGQATEAIGLATSTDGVNFTKYSGNPILTATGNGRNDGTSVSQPAVYYDGTTFTMAYAYRDNNNSIVLPGYRMAQASSASGTWTKVGTGDVLSSGRDQTNALMYSEYHQLTKIDGLYYLIYEMGSNNMPFRIYAASSNTILGPYANIPTNPILKESGLSGSFDRYHVATPFAVQINGVWRLFYQGAQDHDQPYGTNSWPGGMADWPIRAYGSANQ